MRKSIVAVITLLLALALVVPAAFADTKVDVYDNDKLVKSVVFRLGVNEYFVNNEVPGTTMDVAPFLENDRTYVPIRFLSNALGVTDEAIGWESPRVTLAEPGFPMVELAVGNRTICSNGQGLQMDVTPLNRNSRTFLPARFVAEALGYEVDWDAANQLVVCWPAGAEKPDISLIIDHLDGKTPPEPPKPPVGDKKVIVMDGKGEPVTNYEFAKYLKPTSKINWLTYEDFQNNIYELSGVRTHGMRVTKDRVYITQEGGNGRVCLYEGGDVLRVRESSGPTKDKYEYGYGVVNDRRDQYSGWPTADITKVSHIFLDRNSGTYLAIENPMYKGGN